MNVGPFHNHTTGEVVSRVIFLVAIIVLILDFWLWRPN